MKYLRKLYKKCRDSERSITVVLLRYLLIKIFYKKELFLHQKVKINGIKNIITKNKLEIGIQPVGFMHKKDITYINIKGKLIVEGYFSIGRGCRIEIGKDAVARFGKGSYINSNTKLIVMNHLYIGNGCAVSWDCQFLDEDFHEISYSNKIKCNNSIIIGNNVWIGCGAKIYKGTSIADSCVVASDSIVKGNFNITRSLIGGNPAKVIKTDVSWKH